MASVERGRGWVMRLGDCLGIMDTLAPVDHAIFDPPYEFEAHTKARRALKDSTQRRGAVNSGKVRRIDQPLEISFGAISEADRTSAAALVARKRWNGGGKHAFWECPLEHATGVGAERNEHPTVKPIALMLDLIADFTDPGETILDPFAGSGTTGVACLRLGRRFIGIERDPRYFALACERLRAEEAGSTVQAARAGQMPLLGSA